MHIILQVGERWLQFRDPVALLTAVSVSDVLPTLEAVETAVAKRNLYAAGFITYEASAAFGLAVHSAAELPLLSFGLYREPRELDLAAIGSGAYTLDRWRPRLAVRAYQQAVTRIKEAIAAGNTYQVNYTFPLETRFVGDELTLFRELAEAQQGRYMAYVDGGRYVVCSASPELFFRLDGYDIVAKPMKGTAVRGLTLAQDAANMASLQRSIKDRAENVMIVDMIRNDLGRVAKVGSVQVSDLFAVERYPTLLQMTSTVTAVTQQPLSQILAKTFPCASITGAPKVRTMSIIRELEPEPRGIYTGSIGFITPQRRAQFNVAIRTVTIDRAMAQATYNVGSGIVWDSVAAAEYAECQLKAQVLVQKRPAFALLESLLWRPKQGYFLLDRHMRRLLASALYFGMDVRETAVGDALQQLAQTLTEPMKVRLLVSAKGKIEVAAGALAAGALPAPLRLGLARTPVTRDNVWLYHKTTQRAVYKTARSSRPDCDEVLLWNEVGEVTEASGSNVAVLLRGKLLTPPVSSGLLAGTFRDAAMADPVHYHNPHGLPLVEQPLTRDDLQQADEIWLMNSVRGWRLGTLLS